MPAAKRLSPLFTWRSAIAASDLEPTTRLVAFALSLHMNERGGSAFPGAALLSSDTGLAESTVREHRKRLEELGWLELTERGGRQGERRRANAYRATIPDVPLREPAGSDPSGSTTPPSDGATPPGAGDDPSGSRTPGRKGGRQEDDIPAPRGGKRTSPEADALTRDWWDAMKRQGITPTGARAFVSVRGIVQTMIAEGYTRSEIAESLLRLGGRTITKQKLRDQCYGVRREHERTEQATPWFQDGDEKPPPPTDEKPWWQRGEEAG